MEKEPNAAIGGPKNPSESEWARVREHIVQLWWNEDKSFKEVQQALAGKHQFITTYKPFLNHLKQWHLEKKFKEAEMAYMAHQILLCRGRDENLPFGTIRGRVISRARVLAYCRKKKITMEQLAEKAPPVCPTSIQLTNTHQDLGAINAPDIYRDPEVIFQAIQAYISAAFDSKKWFSYKGKLSYPSPRETPRQREEFCNSWQRALMKSGEGDKPSSSTFFAQAMYMIPSLIAEEPPRFLEEIFSCVAGFVVNRMPDRANAILGHALNTAKSTKGSEHPIVRILDRFREFDSDRLPQIAYRALEAIWRSFQEHCEPNCLDVSTMQRIWSEIPQCESSCIHNNLNSSELCGFAIYAQTRGIFLELIFWTEFIAQAILSRASASHSILFEESTSISLKVRAIELLSELPKSLDELEAFAGDAATVSRQLRSKLGIHRSRERPVPDPLLGYEKTRLAHRECMFNHTSRLYVCYRIVRSVVRWLRDTIVVWRKLFMDPSYELQESDYQRGIRKVAWHGDQQYQLVRCITFQIFEPREEFSVLFEHFLRYEPDKDVEAFLIKWGNVRRDDILAMGSNEEEDQLADLFNFNDVEDDQKVQGMSALAEAMILAFDSASSKADPAFSAAVDRRMEMAEITRWCEGSFADELDGQEF